ncbi:MAG: glycerol-3-phosphate acyltransferase [Anaerolineales bacterium]|jgi:glycerol-3-phosphate acyltransferase PlsY
MHVAVNTLALGVLAYLIGSISPAIILTRIKAGSDVRDQGSGHAGATNVMRAAGWGAGVLVLLLDIAKGLLATWLAKPEQWGLWPWAPAVAAVMAQVGHCWPIYFRFQGGMGVAVAVGAMLAVWPLGLVYALGIGVLTQIVIRHMARANFVTGLLLAPLWLVTGGSKEQIAVAAMVGLVASYRAFSDWRRVYRELWLDRER